MRVLIAYNEPVLCLGHGEADSEREILDVVAAIEPYLHRGGFDVQRAGVGRDFTVFSGRLRTEQPDIVVNLFEGFGDDPESECRFASLLEQQGRPFTGALSKTLWTAGRKDIAKQLLRLAGIATPAFVAVKELPVVDSALRWPVIVKPAFRDASCGIQQENAVTNRSELNRLLQKMAGQYGLPLLIEEFIAGREISVAVFDWPDLQVLPPVETAFDSSFTGWHIVSYDAKWQPGSPDHEAINLRYPAELTAPETELVAETARSAYRSFNCTGFVTIDFRLGRDGHLQLLEINPNADLKPSRCLVDSLGAVGIEYADFLRQMVHTAVSRGLQPKTA